jgi:Kef-type K+ transport system membrane component KefB
VAAIWLGMALLASMVSIWIAVPAALVEIVIGALAGNIPGIQQHVTQTGFVTFLAGVGSLVLTFLAGAEIDPVSLRGHWKASVSIGLVSFLLPFLAAFGFCGLVLGWDLHAAEIGGIALSTTSVAVVYAVMAETGLNRHDLGKLILAACFVTDLGTVLALGGLFATYNWLLIVFIVVSTVTVLLLPGWSGWRSPVSATGSPNPRSSCCWWCCSGWAGWPPRRAARRSCPPTSPGWSWPGYSCTTGC